MEELDAPPSRKNSYGRDSQIPKSCQAPNLLKSPYLAQMNKDQKSKNLPNSLRIATKVESLLLRFFGRRWSREAASVDRTECRFKFFNTLASNVCRRTKNAQHLRSSQAWPV
jgi:hypothetical protein